MICVEGIILEFDRECTTLEVYDCLAINGVGGEMSSCFPFSRSFSSSAIVLALVRLDCAGLLI